MTQPLARSGNLLHASITEKIIGAFQQVHYEMRFGYLESVYVNCMAMALESLQLRAELQVPTVVHFRGRPVGVFRADMIVESVVVVEFKTGRMLDSGVDAQVLNYLRCTRLEVALVLHFGQKAEFRRLLMTSDHKLLS